MILSIFQSTFSIGILKYVEINGLIKPIKNQFTDLIRFNEQVLIKKNPKKSTIKFKNYILFFGDIEHTYRHSYCNL